jgi:hypothetical protein
VLVDLPDHDSLEVAHRVEVDRLVQQADMLVWVLDPQKYADAAVHGRYLRSLARHAGVLVVVLNQCDKLTPEDLDVCLGDLRRLLANDGLGAVRVLTTSALTGEGLGELRELLASAVDQHGAAAHRLAADLDGIAASLRVLSGPAIRDEFDRIAVKQLCATLTLAAGVPAVGEAVERTYKHRARAAVNWPPARFAQWLTGLVRRDGDDPLSAPAAPEDAVLRTQAETALRDLADSVTEGLPDPWPAHARHAALNQLADLPDALSGAVASTELGVSVRPAWWARLAMIQWWLLGLAATGAAWLLVHLFVPQAGLLMVPGALLGGAVGWGLLLWAVGWVAAGRAARAARIRAEAALSEAVGEVAKERVLAPIRAELRVYADNREALTALAG